MKILMPNHFPLQGSGSGIYTYNVALELTRAGHEVLVIVPDHQQVPDDKPFKTKAIIFSDGENDASSTLDFNFPCFTTHPRSVTTFYELTDAEMQAYIEAWREAMKNAIDDFKPDIIHAHHVWVTSYVASESSLPYVISCHGTDLMGFKKGPRYQSLVLEGAKKAHKIIAISRQVKSEAIKTYQLKEEQVELIWNGFGSEDFKIIPKATKEKVLSQYDIDGSDKPLISFVGKFTDFKGIDVLLRAASIYEKEIGDVNTLLVGDGALMDEMVSLKDELGLKGVHFLGHQSQDKVAGIYNAADVSIVPSRTEPFGLVAVEALACGTPVVATNAGGLPDFIKEEVGALVPVDDPKRLAEAIIYEIKNGTKNTKGKYANEYAFENFTWKKQVARMIDLYRSGVTP